MTPRPLPSTIAHLDALTSTGAEGWLIISALVGRKWKSRSFPTTDVDGAAAWAARADERGLNVYVRTNLLRRPLAGAWERGESVDTGAAVALAIDLDVAGPAHKQGSTEHPLPPDLATAMRIVADLPPPTLDIATGGGQHLWWLLDEPEVDDPAGLIEEWASRIVEVGRAHGWHVDSPDPARVLRVCGTHRRKSNVAPNLVTMHAVAGHPAAGLHESRPWSPSARYGARDLLDCLPTPAPPEPRPAPAQPRRNAQPDEVSPADAVAMLSWAEILEPYGWTFGGVGRMGDTPCELWRRPGDPTSAYSLKAVPNGPCVVWSDAAGLPVGRGQRLTKFRVFAHLAGVTERDAARLVGARAREVLS